MYSAISMQSISAEHSMVWTHVSVNFWSTFQHIMWISVIESCAGRVFETRSLPPSWMAKVVARYEFFGVGDQYTSNKWRRAIAKAIRLGEWLCGFQKPYPRRTLFREVLKVEFIDFCRRHLPRILSRVHSLYLCTTDPTSGLLRYFLTCGVTLNRLTQLRSLTLESIRKPTITNQLMSQCLQLTHLQRLSVVS